MAGVSVPAAARSVIAAVAKTTFKVGTYNGATDTFTSVVDLNDHVNYWLVSVDLAQPKKVFSRSSTIRAAGERIVNWNYQNRHIKLTINLLYGSSTAALLASVRALLAAIENPPYRLAFAAPNSTVLTYADVVAVTHTIPYDGKLILNQTVKKIVIDFECLPGLPGDRIFLQNLVSNPGFEAPSGPGVKVFNDAFANANPYTAGTATGGVLTVPAGTVSQFGSPSWGAFNQWAIRFQFNTGLTANFYLHYIDPNNKLFAAVTSTGMTLNHTIAGANTQLTSGTFAALTNGTYYWLVSTQFPVEPGYAPAVQATLANDSGGAVGSTILALGPVAAADAVTALVGRPGFMGAGVALNLGGFNPSHSLSLFGPGAWAYSSAGTGTASGAWEQTAANTYPGGPATSYGALRVDAAPAGTLNMAWITYAGGTPTGLTTPIPTAQGHVLGVSVWLKSSGVGAGCTQALNVVEYNSSGTFLVGTTVASKSGAQASWTQLAATYTVQQATCAYVAVQLAVADTTSGSANGTVWFDNVQCYDQTTTGQTVMPYCELRFPQSPAQLLVSSLQGDLPVGAAVSMGFYPLYYNPNLWILGARATPQPGARLIYPALYHTIGPPQVATPALRSDAYGGVMNTWTAPTANPGTTHGIANVLKDLTGSFQGFVRTLPGDTTYASQQTILRSREVAGLTPDFSSLNVIGSTAGPAYPVGASAAVWTWANSGVTTWPLAPQLQTEDLTAKSGFATFDVYGVTGTWGIGEAALMPIDGDTLTASITVNYGVPLWTWVYNTADSAFIQSASWRASCRSVSSLPNLTNAGGGTPSTSAQVGLTVGGSSSLRFDPTQKTGLDGSALGQMVSLLADVSTGANYGAVYEMSYVPQYLAPRSA